MSLELNIIYKATYFYFVLTRTQQHINMVTDHVTETHVLQTRLL